MSAFNKKKQSSQGQLFAGTKMRRKEQIQECWIKVGKWYTISVSRLHGQNAVDPDGHPMKEAKFIQKRTCTLFRNEAGELETDVIGWEYESKEGKLLSIHDDLYQAPKDKWEVILTSGWTKKS